MVASCAVAPNAPSVGGSPEHPLDTVAPQSTYFKRLTGNGDQTGWGEREGGGEDKQPSSKLR